MKAARLLSGQLLDFFFVFAYPIRKKGVLYMSQAVNVNFKLDADVKKSMEQACSELGLSIPRAIFVIWKISCVILRTVKPISQSMT